MVQTTYHMARNTIAAREDALRNYRHMKAQEQWSEHTKRLPPLAVSDHVIRIQNQIGPRPTKWDETGTVIEVRQFDQYMSFVLTDLAGPLYTTGNFSENTNLSSHLDHAIQSLTLTCSDPLYHASASILTTHLM